MKPMAAYKEYQRAGFSFNVIAKGNKPGHDYRFLGFLSETSFYVHKITYDGGVVRQARVRLRDGDTDWNTRTKD